MFNFLRPVLALMALLVVMPAVALTRQDVEHYLLLRDDPATVQLVLATLGQGRATETRTLDIIAQRLIESGVPAAADSARLTMLQSFVRHIARAEDPRYRTTLQVVQAKWAGHPLQADINSALARLPASGAEGYRPGSLTVAGERNRVDVLLRNEAAAADRRQPLPRRGLTTMQQVLDRVGAPDHIGLFVDTPDYDLLSRGSFGVRMKQVLARHLEFVWFGRGSMVFYFDDEWRPVHTVGQLRHPPFGSLDGEGAPAVAHKLMTEDAVALRSLVRRLYGAGQRMDPDLLDVMADRLWLRMRTRDPVENEALAILTLLLGNSGDARYRAVLQDVAGGARDSRLQALGRKMLQRLPAATEDTPPYLRREVPLM